MFKYRKNYDNDIIRKSEEMLIKNKCRNEVLQQMKKYQGILMPQGIKMDNCNSCLLYTSRCV